MTVPAQRSKRRLPRGSYANLVGGISDINEGELCYARDRNALYIKESSQFINPIEIKTTNLFTIHHTLDFDDIGALIEINASGPEALTIPNDSICNFFTGFTIDIYRMGSGSVTLTPASGVALVSANDHRSISAQYGKVTLRKRGANSWIAFGDLM